MLDRANELKIRDTFKKIKADLAQWETLKKYNIDWDSIEIESIEETTIKIKIDNGYGTSDKFFPKNQKSLSINPDEMLTFDLTQLILQAVDYLNRYKNKFGRIDIIDESLGIFQLADRGFCGNEKSFKKPDKADIQLKENGFVILSKQVQMVEMDKDDIGTTRYAKEIYIDDLCGVVDYDKFLEKYDISEDELYKEVDDLLYEYSAIDFVSDENLWNKVDNFLQVNDLSNKLALVAVEEQENVVCLGVVPQLSNKLVGKVIDGDVFEIPAISEDEKTEIINFLADIRQEYADIINDKLDEILSNSYDEKLEQQTQKARKNR